MLRVFRELAAASYLVDLACWVLLACVAGLSTIHRSWHLVATYIWRILLANF
jgi:hypothetical protein